MWFKTILGFSFCVNYSGCWNPEIILKKSSKPVDADLINITNLIIEKYFFERYSVVNIITAVENQSNPYVLDFQTALHSENKGFQIYRLDNHTYIQTIRFRKKTFIVILLDTFNSFEVLLKGISTEKFNFRGHFLFVLMQRNSNFIDKMFELLWKKKIANANVVHVEIDDVKSVYIKSFFPFHEKQCGNTSAVTWKKLIDGKFYGSWGDILPVKTKNLFGCPIRMVTFDRCPASCVNIAAKKPAVDGFNIRIIEIIAEKLNFELKTEILLGPDQWGTILANGTTTGAIKKIVNDDADITIGSYVLRISRLEVMDSSAAYYSVPLVYSIPPGEKFKPLQKLLQPFEFIVWMMILITLSFGILVILIINWKVKKFRNFVYGTGIKNPIMNIVIAIFGGAQTKLPKRNFARFILMLFLLFCLVNRNVYQGSLYIFLQSDGRQKEVESLKDMIAKNFTYYMYESYTDILKIVPEIYEK